LAGDEQNGREHTAQQDHKYDEHHKQHERDDDHQIAAGSILSVEQHGGLAAYEGVRAHRIEIRTQSLDGLDGGGTVRRVAEHGDAERLVRGVGRVARRVRLA